MDLYSGYIAKKLLGKFSLTNYQTSTTLSLMVTLSVVEGFYFIDAFNAVFLSFLFRKPGHPDDLREAQLLRLFVFSPIAVVPEFHKLR